ncbi:hypothetical protein NBRC116493_22370 [Aurantivibrio infirmus]
MSKTDRLRPLDMIDPNLIRSVEEFLMDLHYPMFVDNKFKIFKSGNHLVIWSSFFSVFKKKQRSTQQEFPLTALPWFIDTIEDKFWNHKPDPNALPGDVSESTVIDGEKVGINPSRNCCAENIFGYTFWNASRVDHIGGLPPQEWAIPKFMLEEGLLDELKKISTNLGLKDYS